MFFFSWWFEPRNHCWCWKLFKISLVFGFDLAVFWLVDVSSVDGMLGRNKINVFSKKLLFCFHWETEIVLAHEKNKKNFGRNKIEQNLLFYSTSTSTILVTVYVPSSKKCCFVFLLFFTAIKILQLTKMELKNVQVLVLFSICFSCD